MRRPSYDLLSCAVSVGLSLAGGVWGCKAGNSAASAGTGGTGASAAQGTTGTSPDGTTTSTTGTGFGTGSSTGGNCPVHCSTDLHQVIDCNNMVVTTCPDDMGCGPMGMCIAPCDSAKANASTLGCDFFAVVPAPEGETAGSCFAALVANTWKTPITISADYNGQTLNVAGLARTPMGSGASLSYQPLPGGMLAPGQLGLLFLAQAPSGGVHFTRCPTGVTPGLAQNTSIATPGLTHAFHIATSAPVVAYDIYPYGGATSYVSSATLLVPTPAWGTNYVAADGFQEDPAIAFDGGKPFVQIVASEDATSVTISPTAAITAGPGVAATGQGQPHTYTLNRGQVLQFLQDTELAGSPISSDKPTSVWGGSGCMNIPVGQYACDSAHQELLPVSALGHEYAAVRYRNRATQNESVPWTLVGAVDGTTLTYDPAPPTGAPPTLKKGQLVRFNATDPFVVKSQDDSHPFYVSGHMTGWTTIASNPGNEGDSEYVNVIPPQQYLNHYLFLTDPTYSNTNLVFVRPKAMDGTFKDVTLDCVGTVGGWQPLGTGGNYEYTRVDLVKNGAAQGSCNNGAHTADSTAPFGLTVWGWDDAVSYAYPAGMSTQPINTVVVPPTPM